MRAWIGCSAVLLLAAGLGCDRQTPPAVRVSSAGAQATAPERAARQAAVDQSRRTALVTAAERASRAVVSINATARRAGRARSPWDFFFVPEWAQCKLSSGQGKLRAKETPSPPVHSSQVCKSAVRSPRVQVGLVCP
jgi:hypothetical protein